MKFVDFYFAIKNKNHNFDMHTVFTVNKKSFEMYLKWFLLIKPVVFRSHNTRNSQFWHSYTLAPAYSNTYNSEYDPNKIYIYFRHIAMENQLLVK